jgi:hypothetical protein
MGQPLDSFRQRQVRITEGGGGNEHANSLKNGKSAERVISAAFSSLKGLACFINTTPKVELQSCHLPLHCNAPLLDAGKPTCSFNCSETVRHHSESKERIMHRIRQWIALTAILMTTGISWSSSSDRIKHPAGQPESQAKPAKVTGSGQSFRSSLQDPEQAQETVPSPVTGNTVLANDARDERLAKYLSGTRWTGRFTFAGQEEKPPAEEKYEIIEASKADTGDGWNLVARIQYDGKDVTLPLPTLQIKWAGETPVITVDKMVIPGMGTFDARVLIRKGQYAGTWAHGEVGGHLFGRIEKLEDRKDGKK